MPIHQLENIIEIEKLKPLLKNSKLDQWVTWDETKRISNINKHQLDFADTYLVFETDTFTFEDKRIAYHEQRFVTLGILNGNVVVVVHTETENEIRVISLRKATQNEQKLYFSRIGWFWRIPRN